MPIAIGDAHPPPITQQTILFASHRLSDPIREPTPHHVPGEGSTAYRSKSHHSIWNRATRH